LTVVTPFSEGLSPAPRQPNCRSPPFPVVIVPVANCPLGWTITRANIAHLLTGQLDDQGCINAIPAISN
jgi:hypothetical protein